MGVLVGVGVSVLAGVIVLVGVSVLVGVIVGVGVSVLAGVWSRSAKKGLTHPGGCLGDF